MLQGRSAGTTSGPPIEPYYPYGPGEDPIIEKVAGEDLERVAPERAPESGDAAPAICNALQ